MGEVRSEVALRGVHIGSAPPSCVAKCEGCNPSKPVQCPVTPKLQCIPKSLTHDTTNRLVFELSQNCSTDRHLLQKSETMECMPFYLHRFFCWK